MTGLPAPLTPPDCDLRGLPFMPLDTARLLDSDLFAISTGDEFKAAVALWCKAWQQVPAASLPDDPRILAYLSGAGTRWGKIKEVALRGWIKCGDGRLYHPTIAEKAIEAMQRRREFSETSGNDRDRKRRYRDRVKELSERLRASGIVPPRGASLQQLEGLLAGTDAGTVRGRCGDAVGTDLETMQGQCGDAVGMAKTGTGTERETLSSLRSDTPCGPPSDGQRGDASQQDPSKPPIAETAEPEETPAIPAFLQRGQHEEAAAIEAWNAFAGEHGLAKVQKLTDARRTRLHRRLNDLGGLDGWRAALDRVAASSFLLGENKTGWRADFDFLLQEKSLTKLMEGGYDRSSRSTGAGNGFVALAAEAFSGPLEGDLALRG